MAVKPHPKIERLVEHYTDTKWASAAEIEENYGMALIAGRPGKDAPFSLMDKIRRDPDLYIWNVTVTDDGAPAVLVGLNK